MRPVAAAIAMLLTTWADPAPAGTRRHDVADSVHTSLAAQSDYASVGLISLPGITASGVLIANNYVLTAAHVGESTGNMTFTLPSGVYVRAWDVIHPDWTGTGSDGSDLALIRLSTLVLDEQPAELYTATNEVGRTGVAVGFGKTGTGLSGATEPVGTKRAGENVWDGSAADFGHAEDVLLADFDNPSSLDDNWFGRRRPIALEYLLALGDSGGGVFMSDGGKQKLAAINSFVLYRDEKADSDYGDAMGAIRVSAHTSYLTSNLSSPRTMSWVGASGGFNTAGNWQTTYDGQAVNVVPAAPDAVRFDTAGSHTVTWPAAHLANTRMSVAAGEVTLNLSGQVHTLTDISLSQPSLVVGAPGRTEQALTIQNGTLSTQNVFLAPDAASEVRMTVGAGAVWNVEGSVFVGGTDIGSQGTAELVITADAQVDIAGAITIWSGGTLTLDNATVNVTEVRVEAGGTLAGTGTIVGNLVMFGGVISPGSATEGGAIGVVHYGAIRISAVPEPSTTAALCAGAIVLLARRRNRRRGAARSAR